MKITFNPTTKVQSVVMNDNDRIIQNSSDNYVYLYGIDSGWQVKATFTRRDGVQIGLIGGTYDLDPDDEYCYIIPVPAKATEVDKGLGLSILIYEPSGELFIRHSTIATSMYVYSSQNVIIPDDLDTVLYDALNLAISNLTANKIEHSAIVCITGETSTKDTAIYSKAKVDELDTAISLNINTHKARTDNPHSVSKAQVGLGNADNTSDADKPVSTAQQAALNQKENLSNKRTSWQATPTNTAYPSEKLAKDSLDLKADKATTILGIDLANDIARAEFVEALGNATTLLAGLMSATDKARLDALYALLGATADADAVVNTINEVLAVLANYPEGVDLVTALAGKVDKVTGKGLSTNDYTDAEQAKVSHIPDNFTTYMGDYYTKSQVDTLLDQLTTAYGLTKTDISEMVHNGTVELADLTDYDYVTLFLKHYDTSHFIFDGKFIDPGEFATNGDMIQINAWENGTQHSYGKLTYDGTTYLTFTASDVLDTLVIKGYKKDAVTGLLVEESFTGTNYLGAETNVHDSLVALDTQIKANADDIAEILSGTQTAKKAEQDADGNVITETYETKADATTKENATALKLAEHDELIQDTQETLRKALNSDGVATADDDGTGIIAMGKDVAPAPVRVQVEGLLLDSPNKFNLTTGTANGITYTISGNQITLSGTASAETTLILASGLTATNKAYVNQDFISGTSTGVITLKNGATALNATYGTDYSGVVTLEDTTITLVIANGAVLTNVIYKFNIDVVTTLITNKQYSPLYSTTFDLMSEAQIKAQMDLWVTDGTLPYALRGADMNVRLRATGINLFNKMLYATSYAYKIKVKPSTQYTWSASTAYKTYDINGVEVASGTATTVTTGSGTFYIAFSGIASVDTFMLVTGTAVPSTYAPYQDSDLYLQPNTIGYSLPNGVKDSIEMRDGKLYYVQRVKAYTLTADDFTNYYTGLTNIDLVMFKKNIDFIRYNDSNGYTGEIYLQGFVNSDTYSDNLIYIGCVVKESTTIQNLIVAKGTYASLIAAQTALAGTVIYYQLATPITTLISSSGVLNAFSSGHIYIDYGIIKDSALYGTSAAITNSDYPITELKSIFNVTKNTELAVSGATIASGGLSFTHSGITAGDIVIFVYGYGHGLRGLTTVTYYDDPMIVAGSGTTAGKVYKIVPTVVDANIVWTKVEI